MELINCLWDNLHWILAFGWVCKLYMRRDMCLLFGRFDYLTKTIISRMVPPTRGTPRLAGRRVGGSARRRKSGYKKIKKKKNTSSRNKDILILRPSGMSDLQGTHGSRRRFLFSELCHQCPWKSLKAEISPPHGKPYVTSGFWIDTSSAREPQAGVSPWLRRYKSSGTTIWREQQQQNGNYKIESE